MSQLLYNDAVLAVTNRCPPLERDVLLERCCFKLEFLLQFFLFCLIFQTPICRNLILLGID